MTLNKNNIFKELLYIIIKMNYLEYVIEFIITEETEKKTKEIMDIIKEGKCAFNFIKYIDEDDVDNKKKRTFILTSYSNISQMLFHLFNGIEVKYSCYIKSPIMM
jgi:hypothetical protein